MSMTSAELKKMQNDLFNLIYSGTATVGEVEKELEDFILKLEAEKEKVESDEKEIISTVLLALNGVAQMLQQQQQ